MLYQYLSPLVKMLKDTPDTPAGAYEAGYRFCYDYERPASRTASSIKRTTWRRTPVIRDTSESGRAIRP